MNRRRFAVLLAGSFASVLVRAQQSVKSRRVGILTAGTSRSGAVFQTSLLAGLETLGWKEGRDLTIKALHAETIMADLPRLAREMIQFNPDVIVCSGPAPAVAIKGLGIANPVVFVAVADPVALHLVETLGRPGGNFTGLATLAPEFILAKQIELLRETVPHASRIAFLTNPGNPIHVQGRALRLRAAAQQGLTAVEVEARSRDELVTAFAKAAQQKANVMYLSGDPLPMEHTQLVAELALVHHLPVMFLFQQHVDAGGLMSYGTDSKELWRRGAIYVDKVLNGSHPSTLPVEEPTKYQLVINMKTAKALGITIPQTVLLRADRVIE